MSVTLSLDRCAGCGKYIRPKDATSMAGGSWCGPCYGAFIGQEIPARECGA